MSTQYTKCRLNKCIETLQANNSLPIEFNEQLNFNLNAINNMLSNYKNIPRKDRFINDECIMIRCQAKAMNSIFFNRNVKELSKVVTDNTLLLVYHLCKFKDYVIKFIKICESLGLDIRTSDDQQIRNFIIKIDKIPNFTKSLVSYQMMYSRSKTFLCDLKPKPIIKAFMDNNCLPAPGNKSFKYVREATLSSTSITSISKYTFVINCYEHFVY